LAWADTLTRTVSAQANAEGPVACGQARARRAVVVPWVAVDADAADDRQRSARV